MTGATDIGLLLMRAAIMTRWLPRRAMLNLAALSISALTGTTAMAVPLSVVSTNINSGVTGTVADVRYLRAWSRPR